MSSNNQPFLMRPVYDALLFGTPELQVGLYQLNLATAEQLCRLHYSPHTIKLVYKRLHTLVQHGYLQVDAIPTKKDGRSPRYYTLGAEGAKYLQSLGFDIDESWRASAEVNKHGLFLEHTLELNDVIIAGALLQRVEPRYFLEGFTHERVLKRHPFTAAWQTEGGKPLKLISDAFLSFGDVQNERQHFAVLIEHDRGTEQQVYFKRKVRAYLTFIHAEAYRTMFASSRITIAFTTFEGERRLKQMRDWTRQVLVAHNEPLEVSDAFRFATFPKPLDPTTAWLTPNWYYPDDQPPTALLAA